MDSSTAGRLLVAAPAIGDPNFDRSVVLMLEHSDDGALGLVLNDPIGTDVAEMLDRWHDRVSAPPVFFRGGPVGLDGLIALADGPTEEAPGWTPLRGRLGALDLQADPAAVPGLAALRIFAGHSGWAPGQLEGELAADVWYVVDVHVDDVFTSSPEGLWHDVLRRQPAPLGWLALYPDDPDLN